MPKTFIFLIIGLFFGTGAGFLLAASTGAQVEGHAHGADVHDHSAHDHGEGTEGHDHSQLTEAEGPAPELSIAFHPDGAQSRNLEIIVQNFTFDPQAVNGAHVPGHGHAHVYVNGVKIARAYAPWFHLSALPVGEHEVRVTLNANDHTQLAVEGEPIEVTETLVIE
ncbi:hypothetical protein [Roseovarius sp.]|jgi:hypothetical protein|uniref:hypothetical protein n=1 Tax=Roseovarius sp. TaxID=1486281 RepID=UPI00262921C7|nr:hypothetical protein [Roseovarius sp.]MDM8164432.1 hypothetical protein [Roseovarius sp.]